MVQPCTRCGKCCEGLLLGSVHISAIDMEEWESHPATARGYFLSEWAEAGRIADHIELWVSPSDGVEPARCPWLRTGRKANICSCRIHEVRPQVCRNFPLNASQAI
jgi:Fe-S-cluster containining protein